MADELEEVSAHSCTECCRGLSDIKGGFDYRMKEVDLPEITTLYRERRCYKKVYTCVAATQVMLLVKRRKCGCFPIYEYKIGEETNLSASSPLINPKDYYLRILPV